MVSKRRRGRCSRLVKLSVVGVMSLAALGSAPGASPAAPTFAAITAGGFTTCALTSTGIARCWGSNGWGALGNGSGARGATVPFDVADLGSGVKAISAGFADGCAVTAGGGAKCWGMDYLGMLGDGAPDWTIRPTPVDVVGLGAGVAAVSAGDLVSSANNHTCVLTIGGAVKCFGDNFAGQLGDGTIYNHASTPVDVVGLSSGVKAISSGGNFSCALRAGGVKCWGSNYTGQLGDGTTTNRTTPVDVAGLSSGVTRISAGEQHACALTSAGAVSCWGLNDAGQLGNGTTDASLVPVDVVGLGSGVTAISAGKDFTCAVTSGGGAKCWGSNTSAQLGDGTDGNNRLTPVDVLGLGSGVTAIAAGGYHSCAIAAGVAKCWGLNTEGELGNGTTGYDSTVPVEVTDQAQLGGISVSAPTETHTGHPFTVEARAVDGMGSFIAGYSGAASWSDASGRLTPATPAAFASGVSTTSTAEIDVPYRGDRITVSSNGISSQSNAFDSIGMLERITVGVAGPVSPGAAFTVTATALDGAGNTVTDYTAAATWSNLSGGLSPAAPAGFVNGVSRTTDAVIPHPAHDDRITVASGGASGQSGAFEVLAPARISLTMKDTPVAAGQAFTLVAVALDGSGNRLTSYQGTAAWTSLDGTLAPAAPAGFVRGISTTTATVAVPFHGDRITFTSGSVAKEGGAFNVFGPLAALAVKLAGPATAEPATVGSGSNFTVRAQALDAAGNPLASYAGAASWSDRSGSLSPEQPSAFVKGSSTTAATIAAPFRGDRITVSTGGVSGQSSAFNVAGPLAKIVVRPATPVTHGVAFQVKATATDALGTPIPDYDGSASWTDLSGALSPAAPAGFLNGVSETTATIAHVFANDRITLASGGIHGQSGLFDVR